MTSLSDERIREMVGTYSDLLIRIAVLYMKNTYDAEDVAQGVFLKLLEKRPAFNDSEHEKAWLVRVAVNDCKSRLRSAWFAKTAPLDENLYELERDEGDVLKCVMELPAKYRAVILLHYFEDCSLATTAATLGIRESTAGSLLFRARKLLKKKLGDPYEI